MGESIDKLIPKNLKQSAGQAWLNELSGAAPQQSVMQQMRPMLNQLLGHHGGKSTRLNMDGTLKDMNAPSGLDWLEAHGPDRASVAQRQAQLTQDLGGTTQQKAAQGKQAVGDQLQWMHDMQPKAKLAAQPQQEFVGPPQPVLGQAQPVQNPDALLPWLSNLYDTHITGTKKPAQSAPATAQIPEKSSNLGGFTLGGFMPQQAESVAPEPQGISWWDQLGSQLSPALESVQHAGSSALDWLGSLPQKARGLYDSAGSILPSWMYDAGAEMAGMIPGVGNVPTKDIRAALPTGADTFIPPSNEAGLSSFLENALRVVPGVNFIGTSGIVPQTVSRVNRAHSVDEAIGLPWLTPAEGQQLKQKLNEQATYKFPW